MITRITTIMTEMAVQTRLSLEDLLKLQTWLSPAFPIGSFAYSHGLEQAVFEQRVIQEQDLRAWISDILHYGAGWNDSVLCAQAWRSGADKGDLQGLIALAEAMCSSPERRLESFAQGEAFLSAVGPWLEQAPDIDDAPLGVALGHVSRVAGLPLEAVLTAFLQSFVTALVQSVQRLGRIGQAAGLSIIASLEADILALARKASSSSLEDLGGCAIISDIMSMRHEHLRSRVFRT